MVFFIFLCVLKWCNKHCSCCNLISLIFLCWRLTVMVYVVCRLVILSVLKIALQNRLFWNIWQMGCCCESSLVIQIWKAIGELVGSENFDILLSTELFYGLVRLVALFHLLCLQNFQCGDGGWGPRKNSLNWYSIWISEGEWKPINLKQFMVLIFQLKWLIGLLGSFFQSKVAFMQFGVYMGLPAWFISC